MIKNDQSILNKNGQLVSDGWASIPKIYNNVEVGEFIIMPNHIHGLINIVGVGFLQEEIISTSPNKYRRGRLPPRSKNICLP